VKKESRKDQILLKAVELFGSRGFDSVTIRQLADQCGISEPALYRYFRSKDDIYDGVLDSIRSHVDVDAAFENIAGATDVERILRAVAEHVISHADRDDALHRLLLFSALQGHQKARQVYQNIRGTYVRYLKARLDELHERGLIVEKNNEITARCFVGMVFDCVLSRTLWKNMYGERLTLSQVIDNNVPIFVKGLSTAGMGEKAV
jgi:AcrR family transcriptional regulator